MKLVEKVSHIQGALKAPKGQTNNFGKYKYRSAEDILEAVKPLTTEHGLILTLCGGGRTHLCQSHGTIDRW